MKKMHTIFRTLMYETLAKPLSELRGRVLDLGAGGMPSYRRYLRTDATEIIWTDLRTPGSLPVDFNMPLPYATGEFDAVLCVNALYIADHPEATLREMHRVVKKEGQLVLVTPFVFPEGREPHDYMRWTSEGLERLVRTAGFKAVVVTPFGGHFTAAAYLIEPFLRFRAVQWFVREIARRLDSLVPSRYREAHPCPLGYLVIAKP